MAFSENLKKLREARNFTTEEVASKIDVTEKTYINYEEGKSMPKIDVIIKIADLFEILLDELFDREYYRNLLAEHVTSGYIAVEDTVADIESVTTVAVSDEIIDNTDVFDGHDERMASITCDDDTVDEEYDEICDECAIKFEEDTPIENMTEDDEECETCNSDCEDCPHANVECDVEEGTPCNYADEVRCFEDPDCANCVIFKDYFALNEHATLLLASICDMLPYNLSYTSKRFSIANNDFEFPDSIDFSDYFVVGILVDGTDYNFIINTKYEDQFDSVRYSEDCNVACYKINEIEELRDYMPTYFNAAYKVKRRLIMRF